MITHLKGKLVEKNPTYAVVEVNGVGYLLHISLNTYSKISDSELVFLYTHLAVKEDSHTLFGFIDKIEREIFRMLISVSGVGPSAIATKTNEFSKLLENIYGKLVSFQIYPLCITFNLSKFN